MRLLFINERLSYASTTSYSFDLARALVARGDVVQLCTTGGPWRDSFRRAGIETYVAKFNFLSWGKLLEYLREFDPDLVHVQNLRSWPLARRLVARVERPCIVTVHRRPLPGAPRLDRAEIHGVIAVNEVIREALVNEQHLPKGRIRVIRRGVNLEVLRPEGLLPEAKDRIPVVGSVGRLSPVKGHQYLIEAARRVLDRGLEAHFAIIGEGGEERRLRGLVRRLGLERHVTFAPHIPRLQDLYRLFDIAALPVLRSGVGVSALEAMAMGKPVIASGVGELLHIVQDHRTGLLVREGDAEGLADRIAELIEDPELMRRLARQGRAWVEENFSLEPMVAETRDYYAALLAELHEPA